MHVPKISAKKGLVAGLGALAVVAAGGTAYAATSSPSTGNGGSPPAVSQSHGAADRAQARTLLRRADHAVVELRVKGRWVSYQIDRGRVTAVSPTSITLARPDGQSVTEAITPLTRYRGVTSESGIHTGQPAIVLSEGGSALRVRQGPAGPGTAPAA